MESSECDMFEPVYSKHWTSEYEGEADVELIVEGTALPAHSQILSQSEVLRGAIRDTTNAPGRIRIESLFDGVTLREMDLFLSQVYATSRSLKPNNIVQSQAILDLAMRCGFDQLAVRILDMLTESSDGENDFLRLLKGHWTTLQPDTVLHWMRICYFTGHGGLEAALVEFFVENYSLMKAGGEWEEVTQCLEENPALQKKIRTGLCEVLECWDARRGVSYFPICSVCNNRIPGAPLQARNLRTNPFSPSFFCPVCKKHGNRIILEIGASQ